MSYGATGIWSASLLAPHGGGPVLFPHTLVATTVTRVYFDALCWTLGGSAISHPPQARSSNVGPEVGVGANNGAPGFARCGLFLGRLAAGAVWHSRLGAECSTGRRRKHTT